MAEPMMGPMMQQALGGASQGLPGSDPLMALRSLQQTPGPPGEAQAIKDAQRAIGFAMSRLQMRSPKIAKELASALINLQQAEKELAMLPQEQQVAPPPAGLPMSGLLQGGGGPTAPGPML